MELIENQWSDINDCLKLLGRLAMNLVFLFSILRFAYLPNNRSKEKLFTYALFNVVTFLICFLLRKVPMEMGFALGLFAVFGILRYRTETIPTKDMTYLFVVIGVGILNALANKSISGLEIVTANSVIFLITMLGEYMWVRKSTKSRSIVWDSVDDITPDSKERFLQKLSEKTGLHIDDVEVLEVDYLKESCVLKLYYTD